MLGIAAIPALIQLIMMIAFLPESPYFLMKVGKRTEAKHTVKRFFTERSLYE